MAATFRPSLLAGLFVLVTSTPSIATPITPESAAVAPPDVITAAAVTPGYPLVGAIPVCQPAPDCPAGPAAETTTIPEPAALFLLGSGVVLLTAHRRRRRPPRV